MPRLGQTFLLIVCVSLLITSVCRVALAGAPNIDVYDGFEGTKLSRLWDTTGFIPGAVTMQSDIVRAGHGAMKVVVHSHDKFEAGTNGDLDSERAEIMESRKLCSLENATYEQSFSMFIPTNFPIVATRLVIAQWKQLCPHGGACENDLPLLCIRYASGILRINQVAPHHRHLFQTTEDLRGQWIDFKFQTRFSTNTNGRIRAWLNGKQVVDCAGANAYAENPTTGYPNPSRFYFRMGLYRDVMPEPMTLYIDEYRKRLVPDDRP